MHSLRPWIGIALLAVSWLFGLDYYELPSTWMQLAMLVLGTWMLAASERVSPFRAARESLPELSIASVLLLLPVVWWTPWPYRLAPLLIVGGLLADRVPYAPRVLRPIAAAWTVGGVILLFQAVALTIYAALTARCHDVPAFLVKLLSGLCWLVGIDSAGDGPLLVMQTMRQPIRLAITWDILFDPTTVMFLVGGLAWITIDAGRLGALRLRWKYLATNLGRFALIVIAWLPFRAVLMVPLYLHRAALTDPAEPLHVANQFLSSWVMLATLAVPILLSWRWICISTGTPREIYVPDNSRSISVTYLTAATCCLFGAILLAVGLCWEPAGRRKDGRVIFVERHAPWYASDRPYDTEHFGGGNEEHSISYAYSVAYKYLSQYYEMSRLNEGDAIDDQSLAGCDVLVIRIPSFRYKPEEVRAVVNYVKNGGGLLLIGDHTNWERSSAHMNDISRSFGFTFRDDVIYTTRPSPYDQHYLAPVVPHPAIQHVPAFDFLVSCSIDPGYSSGRPLVAPAGLWSMNADYNYANFMPEPQHSPGSRFGAFIQAWAAHAGEGRVIAWGDSTIFSNFCIVQPGKFPVLLNMIEWLNHQCGMGVWWLWTLLGAAAIGYGLWMVRSGGSSWLVLLAATACGWTLGTTATAALLARELPLPKPADDRRMPLVVIDRTTSRVPLSNSFTNDDPAGGGFALLEQWIPRLGYMTERAEGDAIFKGDAIVMLYPNRPINDAIRQKLIDYVNGGGRLLVVDAGMSDVPSTSNQILHPFGLALDYNESWQGDLILKDPWPGIHVDHAWEVLGGEQFASLNGQRPVCATVQYGKGLVMVASFGTLFNDKSFGSDWSKDPTPEERTRYDVLFAILRRLVKDEPLVVPPARMPPSQLKPRPLSLVRPNAKPASHSKPAAPELPVPSADFPLKLPEPLDSGLQRSNVK
jgi:hypothetical protein